MFSRRFNRMEQLSETGSGIRMPGTRFLPVVENQVLSCAFGNSSSGNLYIRVWARGNRCSQILRYFSCIPFLQLVDYQDMAGALRNASEESLSGLWASVSIWGGIIVVISFIAT